MYTYTNHYLTHQIFNDQFEVIKINPTNIQNIAYEGTQVKVCSV